MITEHDLQEAIAECLGQRNPTASTCIKLAAFYTIKQNMYPEPAAENVDINFRHSEAGAGELDLSRITPTYDVINYDSGSDFSRIINGGSMTRLLEVMDDTMNTLSVINPRLYNNIMKRLSEE